MFRPAATPFDRLPTERPLLKLLLHSNSLRERFLSRDPTAAALLRLQGFDFVQVMVTPTTDLDILEYLKEHDIECPMIERSEDYWVIVEPTSVQGIGPVQPNIDYAAPVTPGSRITWLDFIMARNLDADYFVGDPGDAFFASNMRKHNDLEPDEALNRVRILAANSGIFEIVPNYRANEGFYYLYRFKKVFRSFQKAYTTAVLGGVIPLAAREQLESLAQRLEFICRAADHASFFSLRRADNDNQDRMLYHAAYLVMLITGVFDDLAWFLAHMYSVNVNKMGVGLRCMPTHKVNQQFFAALQAANPSVASFLLLAETQTKLNLFYPVRHRLQHGLFLEALRYLERGKQIDKILFIVPVESVKLMEQLDGPDYRASWGLYGSAQDAYIDPHRFVSRALEIVASITNDLLDRFDWDEAIKAAPAETERQVRESWSGFEAGVGRFLGWGAEPVYF